MTAYERVREAIVALQEPTRTIYRLHLLDALSYETIAEQLQLHPSTVEQHIAEAIVLIDRNLRGEDL